MDFKKGICFFIISFLLTSCGQKIPPVTTCLYDQPRTILHCVDPQGTPFDLQVTDPKADKLVCLPFSDIGIVINYCNSLKQP